MSVKVFVIVVAAVAALAGAAVAMHHPAGAGFMRSMMAGMHGGGH
jgi:hypothetical protein